MPDEKTLAVVVTRQLPAPVENRIAQRYKARLNADDVPLGPAALASALGEADVLVSSITDKLDGAMLEHAGPRLKLIANFGVGVDHIDVEAAHRRGIAVTNTPGVLTDDTADIALALILALPRRIPEGARIIPEGRPWPGWHPMWMIGEALGGKALGVVGMGRIGEATARRAKSFGMAIHYHNRRPVEPAVERELGATYWADLDAMLPAVDFVSLHCPATPATHHLLSRRRLALMKPSAYVVNTARGGVVDEEALCDQIEAGALAGAGLDVFEGEPRVNPRLIRLADAGKTMLLPHMGSGTIEARVRMGERVLDNIAAHAAGNPLPNRVLP
ncbi:MAG TPA: D-glycerate dehydrogenase [Hyphomicrobiales bacterium]|nr:D-glycerate dehydrogenase [Hyphomicrobiales bacterium]